MNKVRSLRGMHQFKSLAKLRIDHNSLETIRELSYLQKCENLEQLSIEGNPFIEDEKYIHKYVTTNLKNLVKLNGEYLHRPNDYNVLSSPS
jgi:tRNA U38,U39,U40 pseudouridine synthase TruA